MRDVARKAGGVHPSTVSLALRNFPGVSESLRKRIKAIARQLGYRPDPLLSAFNAHRIGQSEKRSTPVIAVIADFVARDEWAACPVQQQIWHGAREAAAQMHAKLELFLCGGTRLSPARIDGILLARGITAVLVSALPVQRRSLELDWSRLSAVRIDCEQLSGNSYSIQPDQHRAVREAWRRLCALGYERIGWLAPAELPGRSLDRMTGMLLLEQAALNPVRQIPPLHTSSLEDIGRWLKHQRIDAVLSPFSSLLERVTQASLHLDAPPGFAALDVPGPASPVSGIQPDYTQAGSLAVEQLVTLMRINEQGAPAADSSTQVPGRWNEGSTAPGRRQSSCA